MNAAIERELMAASDERSGRGCCLYVVVRVRIEDGCVQSVYSHREIADDEVVDAETDALATDVAVVAETAVGQMIGR